MERTVPRRQLVRPGAGLAAVRVDEGSIVAAVAAEEVSVLRQAGHLWVDEHHHSADMW